MEQSPEQDTEFLEVEDKKKSRTMPNHVSKHEEGAQSIAFNQYSASSFTETHTIAKLSSQREPPPRDKKGRFTKKIRSDGEFSENTLPSSDSSPLDTPEIDQRELEQDQEESEHEVIRQLADDEESLPGAPDPSLIIFLLPGDDNIEKENHEGTRSLRFPPVEPPSPP